MKLRFPVKRLSLNDSDVLSETGTAGLGAFVPPADRMNRNWGEGQQATVARAGRLGKRSRSNDASIPRRTEH